MTDQTNKIIKIIVREGLIIISLAVVGLICLMFAFSYGEDTFYWQAHNDILKANRSQTLCNIFGYSCVFIWVGAYPLYLFTRFILWTIRTLNKK